jgi:serine/threonine protein kinase
MYFYIIIVVVVYVYPRGGGGDVYRVEEEKIKKLFIIKGNTIIPPPDPTNDKKITPNKEEEKKIKKQKFEELVGKWKEAMKKTENIVKYIDHWYDKDEIYSYIQMEYCPNGDLSMEISKRKNENKKFSEEVFLLFIIIVK